MIYYVHYNGAAWFVKEGEFFSSQGGLTSEWGKSWLPIEAESIEQARERAKEKYGNGGQLIQKEKDVAQDYEYSNQLIEEARVDLEKVNDRLDKLENELRATQAQASRLILEKRSIERAIRQLSIHAPGEE